MLPPSLFTKGLPITAFQKLIGSKVAKVEILDNETLQPIWVGSDIMDVQVQETSTVTKYAVEDGTNRNDHIVHNPTEITMRFTLAGDVSQLFNASNRRTPTVIWSQCRRAQTYTQI